MNGSNTTSFSLLQLIIWSVANCSGNVAGCLYAVLSFVPNPPPTTYLHILFLGDFFGTGFIFLVSFKIPSLPLCVFLPQFVCPVHLFSLSQIKFPVPIFPLANTNIYSNICVYLLESLLAGNDDVFFSYILVLCSLKTASINFIYCL